MSLSSFFRTWLPLLILTTVVVLNWPTGKLDFGNTSPWAGLILEVEVSDPEGSEPGLILAGLPVQDIEGQPGLFVCGIAEWDPNESSEPLLLAGRVEDLRLQQVILLQETVSLHRKPGIRFVLHTLPKNTVPTDLIGGLIQGTSLRLKPVSQSSEPVSVDIGPERARRDFRVEFDKDSQRRWHGDPTRFVTLWNDQMATAPEDLGPYLHGQVTIPATASADGVVKEEGR